MTPPDWALIVAYWFHMLATVVWIGALGTLSWLVIPAGRQTLSPPAYAKFLEKLQKRLDPLAWFCLLLLVGTGLVQMTANPNYGGFLAITNRWGVAILLKHVVFLGMIGVSVYLTWGVYPELRRQALRRTQGGADDPTLSRYGRIEARLLRLNMALSVVVLALTALARAS